MYFGSLFMIRLLDCQNACPNSHNNGMPYVSLTVYGRRCGSKLDNLQHSYLHFKLEGMLNLRILQDFPFASQIIWHLLSLFYSWSRYQGDAKQNIHRVHKQQLFISLDQGGWEQKTYYCSCQWICCMFVYFQNNARLL